MGSNKLDFKKEFEWQFHQVVPTGHFMLDTHLGYYKLDELMKRVNELITTKEIINLGKNRLLKDVGFLVLVEAHELVQQCLWYYDPNHKIVTKDDRVYVNLNPEGIAYTFGIDR